MALSGKCLRCVLQESGASCSPVSIDQAGGSSRSSRSAGSSSGSPDPVKMADSFQFVVVGIQSLDEIFSTAVAAQQQDTDTGSELASHVRATWAAHAGDLYGAIDEYVHWQANQVELQLLPRTVFPPSLYLLFGEARVPSILQAVVAAAGPGGNRQLWSLAMTVLKTAAAGQESGRFLNSFWCGVAEVLDVLLFKQQPPLPQHSSSSKGGCANTSSGAAAPAAVPAGAADACAAVPWLVLAGHCLGVWADDLSEQLRITPDLMAEVQQLTPADTNGLVTGLFEGRGEPPSSEQPESELPFDGRCEPPSSEQFESDSKSDAGSAVSASSEQSDADTVRAAHKQLVARLVRFLQDGSPAAQQLAAAGYPVAAPLAELQAVSMLAAWALYLFHDGLPDECWDEYRLRLQRGVLVMKLNAAAALLRALPCSWVGCNNALCSSSMNFVGQSVPLAKGKVKSCSRCRKAAYCSQECHVAHFKQHKGGARPWRPLPLPVLLFEASGVL